MALKRIFNICFLLLALNLGFFVTARAEYNLGTKEEEYLLFDTAGEVKLGRSLANQIEKKFKFCKDIEMQERIEKIGQKLTAVCDRKDLSYFFTVLESEKANAFALPGGYIYINKGLVEKTDSDDEIAAVLAHEIGHIVARHSIKRLQASLGYNLLSIITLAASRDVRFKQGTDLAFSQIMLGYSREDEMLADRLSVKYVKKSGYDPKAVIKILEKLSQIEKEAPLKALVASYARTHPYLAERIAVVRQEIYGKMDFNDYLNRITSSEQ